MIFGVTFYPDLIPETDWDANFSAIKKAGFNAVRFGEMAQMDFRALDKALALADKHGLKVVLGLPTAQAPQWLIRRHPEIRPVAHDGSLAPEYGPRPNVCRDNPKYKKYVEQYVRKLVSRYARHPALRAWQIDNEPNYPPLDLTDNKDYCHCAASRAAFINFARDKYKTIEKLNAAWGTAFWLNQFDSFDEIATPKAGFWDAGNPHIWLDWFRFKTRNINDWLNWLKAIVREYDREHPAGTNNFTSIPTRVVDHAVVSEGMDYYGYDVYPKGTMNSPASLAQFIDFWRSICNLNGAEFIVSELQAGPNVRWGHPGEVSGGEIKSWTHQLIAHGAGGILYHAWRTPLFGSETGGFGILNPDGAPSERLAAIKEVGREIEITREVLSGRAVQPKVAIGYLRGSDLETFQEEGWPRSTPPGWYSGRGDVGILHGLNSLAGAHKVVWNHINPVDFIFEKHLEAGALPYQAVLLTNPYLLSRRQAEKLLKFIAGGGTLIAEGRLGIKDELAHLYPRPLLEEMLEVKYRRTDILDNKLLIPKFNAGAYGFRVALEAKGGVLAEFEDGLPAIIEKKFGRGRFVYAAYSLFLSLAKEENPELIGFLRSHLPEPQFKIKSPANIEMVVYEGEPPLLYLINHGDAEAAAEISGPGRTLTVKLAARRAEVIKWDFRSA